MGNKIIEVQWCDFCGCDISNRIQYFHKVSDVNSAADLYTVCGVCEMEVHSTFEKLAQFSKGKIPDWAYEYLKEQTNL